MAKREKIETGKKFHIPRRHGHYYSNEFWFSQAYQSLSVAARELFHCLLNELRYTKNKRKRSKREYTNNGSVSFCEIQFKERYGFCSSSYTRARNQLIRNGLIKQTKRGGMTRGDRAKYKILSLYGVPTDEQRWRNYPERNWKKDIPRPKKQMVGVATQWKKGQCGRKLKATLKNDGKKGRFTLKKKSHKK